MTAVFRGSVLAGIAAAGLAQAPQTRDRFQVCIYNFAEVSPEELARAERAADSIYRGVDAQIEWRGCPVPPDGAAPVPFSPARVAIRIFPQRISGRLALRGAAIGSTIAAPPGEFGTHANVWWRTVREIAMCAGATEAQILGHAMAHEVAHLLGVGDNNATGLMHARWNDADLKRLSQGALLFTQLEGQHIRGAIALRLEAEAQAVYLGTRW